MSRVRALAAYKQSFRATKIAFGGMYSCSSFFLPMITNF